MPMPSCCGESSCVGCAPGAAKDRVDGEADAVLPGLGAADALPELAEAVGEGVKEAARACGETDGEIVGEVVSEFVGDIVGEFDGDADGEFDGVGEGEFDGEFDGELEGDSAGEFDGDSLLVYPVPSNTEV